jgi:hypothetical protein
MPHPRQPLKIFHKTLFLSWSKVDHLF